MQYEAGERIEVGSVVYIGNDDKIYLLQRLTRLQRAMRFVRRLFGKKERGLPIGIATSNTRKGETATVLVSGAVATRLDLNPSIYRVESTGSPDHQEDDSPMR